MESHKRSIFKALTYRVFGLVVTIAVAYIVTRDSALAGAIGLADTFAKIFAYYIHERIWTHLPFGREKTPEYEI